MVSASVLRLAGSVAVITCSNASRSSYIVTTSSVNLASQRAVWLPQFHRSPNNSHPPLSDQVSNNKLVRTHTNKKWMAEFAHRCELHAVDLDKLPDESAGLGFSPKDLAFAVGEAGTHGAFGSCDES